MWPEIKLAESNNYRPETFKYDVALSYASQDREYVENVAKVLQDANLRVFFDKLDQEDIKEANFYNL